ncbi:MAG: (2Fe-2S) ferredoxin domain-containing protein [Ignavibacteria bacterium]|nr:(2Fe-2S) ferredoxin domain-containing protein [Ignavibacteria bacterium]
MAKITIADLEKIREESRRSLVLREGAGRAKITVHMGTCGIAAGARDIMAAVLKEIEERKLTDVIVTNSGCAGLCSKEPMITVELIDYPAPVKYAEMTPSKIKKIFDLHIIKEEIVKEYLLAVGSETTH